MKRIISLSVLSIAAIVSAGVFSSFNSKKPEHTESVKVYVQNKCDEDIRIYVTQSGGGATYTIDDNYTKPMSLEVGQKIYDQNQKVLYHEVTSSSEGKTVVICE